MSSHNEQVKISIVIGARPEIIEVTPIMGESERLALDYFILHTGQYYSYSMDRAIFDDLSLPDAQYNLDVGSDSESEQTERILIEIQKILEKESPDVPAQFLRVSSCYQNLFESTSDLRCELLSKASKEI